MEGECGDGWLPGGDKSLGLVSIYGTKSGWSSLDGKIKGGEATRGVEEWNEGKETWGGEYVE